MPRPKEEKAPKEVVVETSGSMAHIEHELAQLRVRFGKGAARVLAGDADQALVLPKIADIVRSHKGGLKVLLEGHRDDDEGQGVDVERALSVMEWLLDGALCPAAGLRVKGHGTSMACPHVSGGAALVLDASPSMKPSAVLAQLTADATKDAITGLKSGDVNVMLFVGEGGAPPTPPTDAPPANCPWYCSLCVLQTCNDNCDFCQ